MRRALTGAFTLSGGIIGAGVLGLPYVFAKSGYLIGLFWLVVLSVLVWYVFMCLAEVTLRTKGSHQLTGYASKYLGAKGKWLMLVIVIFGIYSANLAYLIGEGESLSFIFTNSSDYSLWFGIGFWVIMAFLLHRGIEGLKKFEKYGVVGIIIVFLIIFFWYVPEVDLGNLSVMNYKYFFLPFGATLFALIGFSVFPEMRREMFGAEKKIKLAVGIGVLLPLILYALFTFIFVGVLGQNIGEVSTLSFGKLVGLFGGFTMMTSFYVFTFALKDMFFFDFGLSRKLSDFISIWGSLILFLFIKFTGLLGFVSIIGISGTITGGASVVLILIMNLKAKRKGERKPEIKMWNSWWLTVLLGLLFIIGAISLVF